MLRWKLIASAFAAAFASSLFAQAYPAKPVRIVMPLPAGAADTITRALGQRLSETLGQPFVVENRPGANMIIAAEMVAKSPADGYTLLFATDSLMTINPLVYSRLSYNPDTAFTPVAILCYTITAVMVSAELGVNTVDDLVKLARAQPGKLNYGTLGLGSNGHFAAETFKLATGTEIVHVPFKGGVELIQAIATNQVHMAFQGSGTAIPMIRAGKIKAVAVYNARRQPTLPDTPTMTEAGFPKIDGARAYYGFVAPAGTPREIVNKLGSEIVRVGNMPDFREKYIVGFNLEPAAGGPDVLAGVVRADREKYAQMVKRLNLRLD